MPRLLPLFAGAGVVLATTPAAADRCADGVAASADGRADPILGLLDLATCAPQTTDADAARVLLAERAEKAGASRVEVVAADQIPVTIDRFPDRPFTAPVTLYLRAGDYTFTATLPSGERLVNVRSIPARAQATVLFELPKPAAPRPPPVKVIDLSDGEPTATHTGPPPRHEFGTMIRDKYKIKPNLDAPEPRRDHVYAPAVLLRAGAGVIDSSAGTPMPTLNAAVMLRVHAVERALVVEPRADVGLRGDDADHVVTIGAGMQLRWYPSRGHGPLSALSVLGGARLEVRTADRLGGMPIERFGLAATAGVAVEPFERMFPIELRYEQGITELAGGRPRAVLLEFGVNL
jgi:hypothetical protein